MTDAPALLLAGVHVALGGRPVLSGLGLEVPRGRIAALLGPNGAGKTTTVRVCTGLVTPDAGRVEVLGAAPGSPAASARIGLMPQSTGAWSGVRPGELLAYLARLHAHPQHVDDLVEALALHDLLDTPYRRLSGGQQQAVNLAGALVGRPELVFLDAPPGGRAPPARRRPGAALRARRDAGVAVLLTTHAMDEAAALADHVWILDRGRITVSGTVADLTTDASLEDVFLTHTTGDRP